MQPLRDHFLLRHAHAVDGANDNLRPLSAKGVAQVDALARFLRSRGGLEVAAVWHSPLVRARDTARRLEAGLALGVARRCVAGLLPEDPPERVARLLARRVRPVLVVGHQPHLGALVGLLVAGDPGREVVDFKKCALVRLACPQGGGGNGTWSIRWMVTPELARADA